MKPSREIQIFIWIISIKLFSTFQTTLQRQILSNELVTKNFLPKIDYERTRNVILIAEDIDYQLEGETNFTFTIIQQQFLSEKIDYKEKFFPYQNKNDFVFVVFQGSCIRIVGQWLKISDLLSPKCFDLSINKLKIGYRNIEPFVNVNETQTKNNRGIELSIVTYIAYRNNINLEMLNCAANGSFNDCLSEYKMLNSQIGEKINVFICRNVDMIIGGLSALDQNDDLTSSAPYINDDITWCVPKAKRLPEYIAVMKLFTPLTWCLTFGTGYFLALIVFLLMPLTRHDKQKDIHYTVYLIIFPLCINLPYKYQTQNWILRIFFLFVSFCGLVFFSYLVAQLQGPIVYPSKYIYRQIDNIHDLISKNFILSSSFEARERLNVSKAISSEFYYNNFLFRLVLFNRYIKCFVWGHTEMLE